MSTSGYRYHTITETFENICKGETEWVAIGNFLNDWWYYAVDSRKKLIETPLAPAPTSGLHRWAAFCAAMVEWLCEQDDIPCPSWVKQKGYVLPDPWFYDDKWTRKAKLLATSPASFKRRNIYGGDRMFLSKRDVKGEHTSTL